MKMHKALIGTFLCTLLITGCLPSEREEIAYHTLPQSKWAHDKVLTYSLFVPYGACRYNAKALLRYDNRYDFTHLTMIYRLTEADSTLLVDTLKVAMIGSESAPESRGISYRQSEAILFPSYTFLHSGIYTVELSLCTERPLLYGIDQVGVAFKRLSTIRQR